MPDVLNGGDNVPDSEQMFQVARVIILIWYRYGPDCITMDGVFSKC